MQSKTFLVAIGFLLFGNPFATAERPQISEDRELKEIDLSGWDCRGRLEGSAKTPDGMERNRLKNRDPAPMKGAPTATFDTAAFLRHVGACDALMQGKRRKDLLPAQKAELSKYENQLVSFTGFLVFAYAGPPESTNCGSGDFHDWHLELFAATSDHPPRSGDPTPIVCEITPRTQNGVFRDGTRLQSLAAFIRAPDLSYEPTGHPARRVRITGQLLWDDEHNGSADVGPAVRTFATNKYHNPWRLSAWEIHPVTKIELLDSAAAAPTVPAESPAPAAALTPVPVPTETPAPQFATLTRAITIKIPYGQTVIPKGTKLPVLSRNGTRITVQYLGNAQIVSLDSTDLR